MSEQELQDELLSLLHAHAHVLTLRDTVCSFAAAGGERDAAVRVLHSLLASHPEYDDEIREVGDFVEGFCVRNLLIWKD